MKYTKRLSKFRQPQSSGFLRQLTTATLRGNAYRPLLGSAIELLEELGAFDDIAVDVSTHWEPTVCGVGLQPERTL